MSKPTIRSANSHVINNPPMGVPIPIPGDRSRKTGAGVRYPDSITTGPTIERPTINAQAQSARSNANFDAPVINHGEGTNTREISRDSVALPNVYSGGGRGTTTP